MEYRIVPMTAEHIPQIAALEKVCFAGEAWSEAVFVASLRIGQNIPNTAYLAAVDPDGTVLGYAMMSAVLDEGNLDNIAVAPDCRRQGVGDALLNAVTDFARTRGLAVLMLEVRASNAPAIALYEKHGFRAVGRRKNYYTTPREDAVLMTAEF